ncbi:hypothetical protein DYU11_26540 [Fibrisoma montanum]|uniref:Uncharacterized protein n=1 Tax=Fibrisoma montanum TaxID=2305895 RepID=A0A418M0E8_9BACT|nr:hypothetical protein DYU11_26540 [Fibrisoma montanum]
MIEAESVAIVESVDIIVDESVDIVLSVPAADSVSVFLDEQEVARAIIAMKKNADFAIAFMILGCLSVVNGKLSTLIHRL